jgi:PTS system N-acetylgalactosamine-specific IIA component
MTSSARGVVAGHGSFASGLISAVEQITGVTGALITVGNAGLSPGGIETALRDAVAATGATVIFTDLPAGSCTLAARRIARTDTRLAVVTGVTLPTLLAFVLGAGVREAVDRGRESLLVVEGGGAP